MELDSKDYLLLEFIEKQTDWYDFRNKIPNELLGEFVFGISNPDSIPAKLIGFKNYHYIELKNSNSARITDIGRKKLEEEKEKLLRKEKIENLKIQQLEVDVMNLTNLVADYPKTKSNASNSFKISVVSALAATVSAIAAIVALNRC